MGELNRGHILSGKKIKVTKERERKRWEKRGGRERDRKRETDGGERERWEEREREMGRASMREGLARRPRCWLINTSVKDALHLGD